MKIELISIFESNYDTKRKSRLFSFPTLINLAALTPEDDVSVRYEQTSPVDIKKVDEIDADLIGISFISTFADRAFAIADKFIEQDRTVVLGGPYVTAFPEKCRKHASSIVVGEAEKLWPRLVRDFKKGQLQCRYQDKDDPFPSLEILPIPRYDLIVDEFILSQSLIATRGCPHSCDFCFMKKVTKGFRTRPIKDVIRDLQHHEGKNWVQNKVAFFWDDNLIGNVTYAKELFRQLKPLKKWWIAQVTASFALDDELLKLAADSGCIAVYVGFESFNQESLKDVRKFHNRVSKYRQIVKKIHSYGIAVCSGLIVGFDNDTIEVFDNSVKTMHEVGIDWVNTSILIPIEGTPVYERLREENRILTTKSYFYSGSVAAFKPKLMSEEEMNKGFLKMRDEIFSFRKFIRRFRTFLKDVPLRKVGAYLFFLIGNIMHLFLKRKKIVVTEADRIKAVLTPVEKKLEHNKKGFHHPLLIPLLLLPKMLKLINGKRNRMS